MTANSGKRAMNAKRALAIVLTSSAVGSAGLALAVYTFPRFFWYVAGTVIIGKLYQML